MKHISKKDIVKKMTDSMLSVFEVGYIEGYKDSIEDAKKHLTVKQKRAITKAMQAVENDKM